MGSGVAMGVWLALSSFTLLGVKLLARRHAGAADFAHFAVVLDISSRVVGLIGSMVVVNYFPRLARAVRNVSKRSVDVLLLEGLAAHVALALVAGGAVAGIAALLHRTDGVLTPLVVAIYLALVVFQATPIAHKPLELSGRPILLIGLFFLSQIAGFAVMTVALRHTSIGLAAGFGIGATGLLYTATVFVWWNLGAVASSGRKRLA